MAIAVEPITSSKSALFRSAVNDLFTRADIGSPKKQMSGLTQLPHLGHSATSSSANKSSSSERVNLALHRFRVQRAVWSEPWQYLRCVYGQAYQRGIQSRYRSKHVRSSFVRPANSAWVVWDGHRSLVEDTPAAASRPSRTGRKDLTTETVVRNRWVD